MSSCQSSLSVNLRGANSGLRLSSIALILMTTVALSACGSKENTPGQSLVKVNGQEITVHQVNDELMRNNIPAAQKDAATKQLVEALIDRQLLQDQATHDKVDRDPAVVQAIERAKSQIIAQAYLQKRLAKNSKPTKEEIQAYYDGHPDLFAKRKVYEMNQVILSNKDFSNDLKIMAGNAKSLSEMTAWLDAHHVAYTRNQMAKSSGDLPPDLLKKMQALRKGQLFVVQESGQDVLVSVENIKDTPVTAAMAETQIGQFLYSKKNKEAADAEIARLRTEAKIEYLNQPKLADNKGTTAPATPVIDGKAADTHLKKGVAGL